MIQRRKGASLALEARSPILVVQENPRYDLDRDFSSEACVARLVDLAHAARSEGGQNFVRAVADPRSDRQELDLKMRSILGSGVLAARCPRRNRRARPPKNEKEG